MARKLAGSILIVGIALFWVGSGMWESLGWWTLAVPAILFAVALVWTYRTNATDVPEQKEPEQNLQYEIELAASEQRQEEIYRHHKQGGLTDKETLLVWLVFDDWIQLPLPKFYQDKVANADQVFMEFVRQGYFQAADAFTVAEKKLKVAQIKAIFLEHGLPLGGNKSELLERLFMRLPEVVADIVSQHQLYRPTERGRQIGIYLDEKQRSHAMEGTVAVARDHYLNELGYLKIHSVYFSGSLLQSTGQSNAIPNALSYHDDPATKRPGLDGGDGAVYAVAGRHYFEYRAAGDVGKPARIAAADGAGHHQLCAYRSRADSTLGLAGRSAGYT